MPLVIKGLKLKLEVVERAQTYCIAIRHYLVLVPGEFCGWSLEGRVGFPVKQIYVN